MILIIRNRASQEEVDKISEDLNGYIKIVADIEQDILAAGGTRHFEAEQKLLKETGSKQSNLWGGGIDLETGEIDYDSIINIRPRDNNPSREILSLEIRNKFDNIVIKLLK